MDNNLKIVCYTGGACGDLITALIDPTGAQFVNTSVLHNADRMKLKKFFLFDNDQNKDQYLKDMSIKYRSIPSHDLNYHVSKNHDFVTVVVDELSLALRAATRFKQLHRPHVWEEMARACNIATVEDYAQIMLDYSQMVQNHTSWCVPLRSIFNGKAIEVLEEMLSYKLPQSSWEFYKHWLELQRTQ